MKQRRARRGKPSSAKRVAAWRERANRAYTQWRVVKIEMGAFVKSGRMTAAIELLLLPQPTATAVWTTEIVYGEMAASIVATNHDTSCQQVLSVIVKQWQFLIRTKHSVIYQLVSTRTATGHCGMVEYRICTERYKEQLSSIRDIDYTDNKKYAFMSRHSGPGAWIFIPYIFSHIPVKKQIPLALCTLESREIQLYP